MSSVQNKPSKCSPKKIIDAMIKSFLRIFAIFNLRFPEKNQSRTIITITKFAPKTVSGSKKAKRISRTWYALFRLKDSNIQYPKIISCSN